MSFVQLDNGKYPPLGQTSQNQKTGKKKFPKQRLEVFNTEANNYLSQHGNQEEGEYCEDISESLDFVRCRVGVQLGDYHEDLEYALSTNNQADFILTPIQPIRPSVYSSDFEVLPDLALACEDWHCRVAIYLAYPSLDESNFKAVKEFDKLFRHALYLSSPVIIITCPDSELAYLSIASTINARLGETKTVPLVLIWVPSISEHQQSSGSKSWVHNKEDKCDEISRTKSISNSWHRWNSIRAHLNPDSRIGVCISIEDDLVDDEEELARWTGEPVKMVILSTDQFVSSVKNDGSVRLNVACREFITRITLANSLETSFVIRSRAKQNMTEYLFYLNNLAKSIKSRYYSYLLSWNDRIQPPLQPLSSNLDSGTYGVFEMDRTKYITYKDAMVEAIKELVSRKITPSRKFVVMVLGAGRGPLVDSFIDAIKEVNSRQNFRIFALDKNPSSVRSLRFKKKRDWADFDVEVVENDMRKWEPGAKADIIVTELLGSLSDNELSPECIDGVWRFSTADTISIPQQYASYIAPVCNYKVHQGLFKLKLVGEPYVYDQIYVVRLSNCYHISKPQQLFKFEHYDLNVPPKKRFNERYVKLVFASKVDTVCHGFAGYFVAKLFGSVKLSTLFGDSTPDMNSWFPAFIPLEEPIEMPKGTEMEIHFWRKESSTRVWYEWVVTRPRRTRIFSPNGMNSAMSKFI